MAMNLPQSVEAVLNDPERYDEGFHRTLLYQSIMLQLESAFGNEATDFARSIISKGQLSSDPVVLNEAVSRITKSKPFNLIDSAALKLEISEFARRMCCADGEDRGDEFNGKGETEVVVFNDDDPFHCSNWDNDNTSENSWQYADECSPAREARRLAQTIASLSNDLEVRKRATQDLDKLASTDLSNSEYWEEIFENFRLALEDPDTEIVVRVLALHVKTYKYASPNQMCVLFCNIADHLIKKLEGIPPNTVPFTANNNDPGWMLFVQKFRILWKSLLDIAPNWMGINSHMEEKLFDRLFQLLFFNFPRLTLPIITPTQSSGHSGKVPVAPPTGSPSRLVTVEVSSTALLAPISLFALIDPTAIWFQRLLKTQARTFMIKCLVQSGLFSKLIGLCLADAIPAQCYSMEVQSAIIPSTSLARSTAKASAMPATSTDVTLVSLPHLLTVHSLSIVCSCVTLSEAVDHFPFSVQNDYDFRAVMAFSNLPVPPSLPVPSQHPSLTPAQPLTSPLSRKLTVSDVLHGIVFHALSVFYEISAVSLSGEYPSPPPMPMESNAEMKHSSDGGKALWQWEAASLPSSASKLRPDTCDRKSRTVHPNPFALQNRYRLLTVAMETLTVFIEMDTRSVGHLTVDHFVRLSRPLHDIVAFTDHSKKDYGGLILRHTQLKYVYLACTLFATAALYKNGSMLLAGPSVPVTSGAEGPAVAKSSALEWGAGVDLAKGHRPSAVPSQTTSSLGHPFPCTAKVCSQFCLRVLRWYIIGANDGGSKPETPTTYSQDDQFSHHSGSHNTLSDSVEPKAWSSHLITAALKIICNFLQRTSLQDWLVGVHKSLIEVYFASTQPGLQKLESKPEDPLMLSVYSFPHGDSALDINSDHWRNALLDALIAFAGHGFTLKSLLLAFVSMGNVGDYVFRNMVLRLLTRYLYGYSNILETYIITQMTYFPFCAAVLLQSLGNVFGQGYIKDILYGIPSEWEIDNQSSVDTSDCIIRFRKSELLCMVMTTCNSDSLFSSYLNAGAALRDMISLTITRPPPVDEEIHDAFDDEAHAAGLKLIYLMTCRLNSSCFLESRFNIISNLLNLQKAVKIVRSDRRSPSSTPNLKDSEKRNREKTAKIVPMSEDMTLETEKDDFVLDMSSVTRHQILLQMYSIGGMSEMSAEQSQANEMILLNLLCGPKTNFAIDGHCTRSGFSYLPLPDPNVIRAHYAKSLQHVSANSAVSASRTPKTMNLGSQENSPPVEKIHPTSSPIGLVKSPEAQERHGNVLSPLSQAMTSPLMPLRLSKISSPHRDSTRPLWTTSSPPHMASPHLKIDPIGFDLNDSSSSSGMGRKSTGTAAWMNEEILRALEHPITLPAAELRVPRLFCTLPPPCTFTEMRSRAQPTVEGRGALEKFHNILQEKTTEPWVACIREAFTELMVLCQPMVTEAHQGPTTNLTYFSCMGVFKEFLQKITRFVDPGVINKEIKKDALSDDVQKTIAFAACKAGRYGVRLGLWKSEEECEHRVSIETILLRSATRFSGRSPDWFTCIVYFIFSAPGKAPDIDNTWAFLAKFQQYSYHYAMWYETCVNTSRIDCDSQVNTLHVLASLVEHITENEAPEAYSAFVQCAISIPHLVAGWLQQHFLDILEFGEVLSAMMVPLVFGIDYLVYICVWLLKTYTYVILSKAMTVCPPCTGGSLSSLREVALLPPLGEPLNMASFLPAMHDMSARWSSYIVKALQLYR